MESGTPKLKHFRIVGNDSFDMFMIMINGNPPRFAQTLEVLYIESASECALIHHEPDNLVVDRSSSSSIHHVIT